MADYKDYYKMLGVDKTADAKEIKAAFRKLAAKHHPDRNPDNPSAEEKFKEINEAYTVLSDEKKRSMYDRFGTADGMPNFGTGGFPGGAGAGGFSGGFAGGSEFSDFFQTLFGNAANMQGDNPFGNFKPNSYGENASIKKDVKGNIKVSLEQAFYGTTTMISVENKRIEVHIPKGIRDGAKLRLRGQAPSGGNVYLTVELEPDANFSLEGNNLRTIVSVPDYTAALGGTVRVPTLEGDVNMTLPETTEAGKVLRLKGKGWYAGNKTNNKANNKNDNKDASRGDQLVEVRVTVPNTLSETQREAYENLKAEAEKEQ